jgi:hypothetical protein
VDEAEQHIAGFILLNDFFAPNVQFHEMRLRLGPAKGKDTANALGTGRRRGPRGRRVSAGTGARHRPGSLCRMERSRTHRRQPAPPTLISPGRPKRAAAIKFPQALIDMVTLNGGRPLTCLA